MSHDLFFGSTAGSFSSTTTTTTATKKSKSSAPKGIYLRNPLLLVDEPEVKGEKQKHRLNGNDMPIKKNNSSPSASGSGDDGDCEDGISEADSSTTEDADDEDDDEDEEPAVGCPLGERSNKSSAFKANGNSFLKVPNLDDHRVGLKSTEKRRSVSNSSMPRPQFTADELQLARASSSAVLETDDDDEGSDIFPRSNIERTYSNSSAIRRSTEANETDDDVEITSMDGLESIEDDISDDDIEELEERAIINELEGSVTPTPARTMSITEEELDLDLAPSEDLFSESDFGEMPGTGDLFWSDKNLANLFFDYPSGPASPVSQPKTPPASPTSYGLAHQVVQESFSVSSGTETDSDIEDIDLLCELVQQPVQQNNRRVRWQDTEGYDSDIVENIFASTDDEDSGSAMDEDEDYASESGDDADAEDGGDTTEEEEDLPMPTPRGKSNICQASDLPITQNALIIAEVGPQKPIAGNFLADASRPICIINGTNKTYIVPSSRPPVDEDDSDYEAVVTFNATPEDNINGIGQMWEIDIDFTALQSDPAFGGMIDESGGFMNGTDIMGPPEAFFNASANTEQDFMEVLDEYMTDAPVEDEDATGDAILALDDLLNMSTDEEGDDSDVSMGTSRKESMSDILLPEESAEAMLSLWDQVSVTAFRKRQIAHQQRLNSRSGNGSPGQKQQKKLLGPDTTMTPIRKKKLKRKIINTGPSSGNSKKKLRIDEEIHYETHT